MPGNYTLRKTYVDGDILAASDYVADHQQHIDNQDPQHTGDYSDNLSQMRTITDHGDVNSESLATTLAGEIERLRYAIKHIKEKLNGSTITQWYSKSYSTAVPNNSVTSAKIADGALVRHTPSTFASGVIAIGTSFTNLFGGAGIAWNQGRSYRVIAVGGFGGTISATSAPYSSAFQWRLTRNGTPLHTSNSSSCVLAAGMSIPFALPGVFWIDNNFSATGATYQVQAVKDDNDNAMLAFCTMSIWEL